MIGANRNYQVSSRLRCRRVTYLLLFGLSLLYQISFGDEPRVCLLSLSWSWFSCVCVFPFHPIHTHPHNTFAYHISVLDKESMFTVFTERDGKPWSHSVKALQIIWNRFPQLWVVFSFGNRLDDSLTIPDSDASNTIHVDDLVSFFRWRKNVTGPDLPSLPLPPPFPFNPLSSPLHPSPTSKSRNFALNPQSGLKIHAFKNAHTPGAQADRELDKLARYMVHIAPMSDLTSLTHGVSVDSMLCSRLFLSGCFSSFQLYSDCSCIPMPVIGIWRLRSFSSVFCGFFTVLLAIVLLIAKRYFLLSHFTQNWKNVVKNLPRSWNETMQTNARLQLCYMYLTNNIDPSLPVGSLWWWWWCMERVVLVDVCVRV